MMACTWADRSRGVASGAQLNTSLGKHTASLIFLVFASLELASVSIVRFSDNFTEIQACDKQEVSYLGSPLV